MLSTAGLKRMVLALNFPSKLHAVFFQLELLDLPTCGLGVIVYPEDIFGNYEDLVSI